MPRHPSTRHVSDRGERHAWMLENAPPAPDDVQYVRHGITHPEMVYMGRPPNEDNLGLRYIYCPDKGCGRTTIPISSRLSRADRKELKRRLDAQFPPSPRRKRSRARGAVPTKYDNNTEPEVENTGYKGHEADDNTDHEEEAATDGSRNVEPEIERSDESDLDEDVAEAPETLEGLNDDLDPIRRVRDHRGQVGASRSVQIVIYFEADEPPIETEVEVDEFGLFQLRNAAFVEMFCPQFTGDVIDLDLQTVGDIGLALYDPCVCGFVMDVGLDQTIHTSPKVKLVFRKIGVYPSQCCGLVERLRDVHRALSDLWRVSNLFPGDPGDRTYDAGHTNIGWNVHGGDGVAGSSRHL